MLRSGVKDPSLSVERVWNQEGARQSIDGVFADVTELGYLRGGQDQASPRFWSAAVNQ
jgi:hypothetical protein